VLGGHVVGPEASEPIAELTVTVENGLTVTDFVGTVHAHPTFSEAVGEAAGDALGGALHSRRQPCTTT
jgi:dihydrolipoamide dehydrogenase